MDLLWLAAGCRGPGRLEACQPGCLPPAAAVLRVWGTAYLGPGTPDHGPGSHWSDFAFRWDRSKSRADRDLGLVVFCQRYEAVEPWFDARPIARWWGGTHLTNDRLWRYDPVLMKP